MDMNSVLLSVNQVSKTFKGEGHQVVALNKVTFHLNQGEFLAIMGTSGSGKSTMLNILGAMDHPDEGTIALRGKVHKDIFREPHATEYRRGHIGFVFQSFHLLKDLSVEENMALPLILEGRSESEVAAKVDHMLELVGLTKWRAHRPMKLSGGQQQRVAIGRALITSPPILLADEPTGNLDVHTSTEIMSVLAEMKSRLGQSIVLVTHDPSIAAYADRVIFFHDGQIMNEYRCSHQAKDMENIMQIFKTVMETAL